MRKLILLLLLLGTQIGTGLAQWSSVWTSDNVDYYTVTGWIQIRPAETEWRFYSLDTLRFQVMNSAYSQVPQYTYTFNPAEQFAGEQIYCMNVDLNGNGTYDFYILSWYGAAASYRQAFKIFDLTTNTTIFERNDPSFSYTYPSVWDVNGDGELECVFTTYDYPNSILYRDEVYHTGIPATSVNRESPLPRQMKLGQNYPNPFNPETTIEYSLNEPGKVNLDVYNLAGQKVQSLINEQQLPGVHSVHWTGTTAASGTYFYQMRVNNTPVDTKKMLLVK